MKKTIFTLLAVMLLAGTGLAQEKRHEVYGGAGLWGTNTILDVFSDIIVTGITGGAYTSENDEYFGEFFLGYKYLLSERIALGGTFSYANSVSDAMYNGIRNGEFRNNYYTLAAEVEYRYISRPRFKLYSAVGAGATLYNQKYLRNGEESSIGDDESTAKKNRGYFNFQVSPVGIKYGRTGGIFAELGFGYKGIISAGGFWRF